MKETDISALVFLILGGIIVYGILTGIFKMIGTDWTTEPLNGAAIWRIFKWSFIALVLLLVYIFGIMPRIQ